MHHTAQVKLYRGFWYAVWTEDGKTKRQSLKTKDYEAACRRLEYLKRFPKGDLIRDAAALYLPAKQEEVVDPERLAPGKETDGFKAADLSHCSRQVLLLSITSTVRRGGAATKRQTHISDARHA